MASGIVHGLIGVLAITVVARRGRAEADQVGALTSIAEAPFGLALLWSIALLLFALGIFHVVHGFALTRDSRKQRWGRRIAEWGQGIAFCVMGGIATAIAVGARPDPDRTTRDASRGLLTLPGGTVLLILVGIGVAAVGIAWISMGITRSFRKQMKIPSGNGGHAIAVLGATGFIAKGGALLVVAVLLAAAGVQGDSSSAGALDSAITSLYDLPGGPVWIVLIGAGFLAYGLFCLFRARFAKL